MLSKEMLDKYKGYAPDTYEDIEKYLNGQDYIVVRDEIIVKNISKFYICENGLFYEISKWNYDIEKRVLDYDTLTRRYEEFEYLLARENIPVKIVSDGIKSLIKEVYYQGSVNNCVWNAW